MHLQTICIKPFCIISKIIQTEIIQTPCINSTCIFFKFIQTEIIHTACIKPTCIFFRFIQIKIIHISVQAPADEIKVGFSFRIFGPKGKIRKRESLARNIPFGASAEAQVQTKPPGNIRKKKNSPGPVIAGQGPELFSQLKPIQK
jgi:hypothetical protein